MSESPAQSIALKTCSRCKTEKSVELFGKAKKTKDGVQSWCKGCFITWDKENRSKRQIFTPKSKVCSTCGSEKFAAEFPKNKAHKDGLDSYCCKCRAKKSKTACASYSAREYIVTPLFKVCPTCATRKTANEFCKSKNRKDGLSDRCRGCASIHARKYLYGVSKEWFTQTLESQGGGCAICGTKEAGGRGGFHVDHNHKTDRVRGLLCSNCNLVLGLFRDNPVLLENAKDYVNSPSWEIKVMYKPWLSKTKRNKILDSQGFLCKICSADLSTSKACLDHCHKSGLIRGGLCHNCNAGLGSSQDSSEILSKAIAYLQKYSNLETVNETKTLVCL